jgi:hypothetical protein
VPAIEKGSKLETGLNPSMGRGAAKQDGIKSYVWVAEIHVNLLIV